MAQMESPDVFLVLSVFMRPSQLKIASDTD